MQKSILDRFIAKYNLGGAAESVLWKSTGKTKLETKFITDDKNVLGIVSTDDFSLGEDAEVGVYETAQLRSLLGVLDEDVNVKVNRKDDGEPYSVLFRDASTKATFILADKTVIPGVPSLKELPDFDLTVNLDNKFSNTFVKGKNALPDTETFALNSVEGGVEIIIGYSAATNTNRVTMKVDMADGSTPIDRTIQFSARYMKEILTANKEARGGTLKVSSQGLAYVTFDVDGFEVAYYLVEIQTA